jgi:hypothetical protein
MFGAAIRRSDGILGWAQSYISTPNKEQIILNMGVNVLGGTSADYDYQDLTDEQGKALEAAMPARSKLVSGVLTSATPITATLSAATVEADGITEIMLSVDCHDASFAGEVKLTIINPSNEATLATATATAGLASFDIRTSSVGGHRVEVETLPHGFAFGAFEGV